MKKLSKVLLLLTVVIFVQSCYYDEFYPEAAPDIPDIPDTEEVSFANDIQPIFTARCVGCHNSTNTLDLREGQAYGELVPNYVIANDADNSELWQKMPGIGHPFGVSASNEPTVDELALIKAWINQGAKNN